MLRGIYLLALKIITVIDCAKRGALLGSSLKVMYLKRLLFSVDTDDGIFVL